MRERVSVIKGRTPILLVAPHGGDDINTALLAEIAAKDLNCSAVINRGFERADTVDVDKDQANCNRIDHIKQSVVYEEFLQPIQKIVDKQVAKNYNAVVYSYTINANFEDEEIYPMALFIAYIHGCGNLIHKQAGKAVEVVMGYGLGIKTDSLTCEEWRLNFLVHQYQTHGYFGGDSVFVGGGGSKFAGRDSNNLNQYYRKHQREQTVNSVQFEFPYSTRQNEIETEKTALNLAFVLKSMLLVNSFDKKTKINLI